MSSQRTLRRVVIAASLALAFLSQGTWALAGVTGNIAGTVKDASGSPLAGVQVQVVAPSETRSTTTDSGGHFTLLSLTPDTYTINLSKATYQNVSYPGVVVFADQTQQVAYTMSKALITIGHVTSQAGASLVKSGVGSDLYSVNASQAAAAAALGGGGNLNNAYSALASVPGVQTSQGGMGWDFNAAYVRGQNSYYTAYEYDGIPVNRAFDNYNSSTESSLGLSELQVYTGGGPSSIASAGTSGFINQVIKTGTFPGFATANLGISTPQYYHQAAVEIGGSTPDRTFSYYVGLLGYNQTYRFFDNNNGAGYMTPGGFFSGNTDGNFIGYGFGSNQVVATCFTCLIGTGQGVKPVCPLVSNPNFTYPSQGCWQYYSGTSANPLQIADREDVVNLHMGIPKNNGLRDDVQLLWSASALTNYFYQSPQDIGPGYNQFIYSFYGTKPAAPVCGPETIAPGLTVNGCTSQPGQIAAFTQPNNYYLGLFGWDKPYPCPNTNPKAPLGPGFACGPTYFAYGDNVAYNTPFGATIATPTSTKAPGIYFAPDTPAHAYQGQFPISDNSQNTNRNDTGITKIQYTYQLSSSAYLRAYGYTFYSDWLQNDPLFGASAEYLPSDISAQYQLITHTSGGALNFQDQINDQNLVSLDGNYTTASVSRFNNTSAYAGCLGACSAGTPIGYVSGAPGSFVCRDAHTGGAQPCLASSYFDTNLSSVTSSGVTQNCSTGNYGFCTVNPTTVYNTASPNCDTKGSPGPCGWMSFAQLGPTGFGAGTKANWVSLWNGNATGADNTVRPEFTNGSISDQFRPNDRFLFNASLRYDNFTYQLPNSNTAANSFYANMTANYTCVLASTNQVLTQPLPPGGIPPAAPQYVVGDCNKAASVLFPTGPHTGWVHPNGVTQDGVGAPNFTASSPSSYSLNYWEPRFSMTYTQSPDVVWRLSAGRFTQPPISASVQYTSLSGDNRSLWDNMMNLGFYSPFHPIPGISSGQYDLSYEQHFKGTDMSMKLTPFYTWVSNWQQQTFIGAGFVTQVPVGVNRNEGFEFQFNKGDFTRNGLSGQLAFTYTNSKVQFQNIGLSTGGTITSELVPLNQVITQYNQLTKAGGGSPCYQAGKPVSCSTPNGKILSGYDTILNPYYNASPQGLLNLGGWYNPYTTAIAPNLSGALGSYISPFVSSLIVNWRHDKLAVTPSFNFQSGGYYGTPLDTNGIDPRTCVGNSLATGITKLSPHTNPLQCNYLTASSAGTGQFTYLYIPDPQTGQFYFDNIHQPSSIVGNLQLSYDVSPRIKLTLLGAALFHSCFGGQSEPWTTANPPSNVVCGYTPDGGTINSTLYPSNFYNGTGIGDRAANHATTPFTQSYIPAGANNGAIGGAVPPINLYFNAQVKI